MYAVDGMGSPVAAAAKERQKRGRMEAEQMRCVLFLLERRDLSDIDSEVGEGTNRNAHNESVGVMP